MKSLKLFIMLLVLGALILALSGCGPQEDDVVLPNAGDGASVELPFATSAVQTVSVPKESAVIGWNGETLKLTEGKYSVHNTGSIGTSVQNLQKRLIELGYMTGTTTGKFDEATALGVKRFETEYGRTPTGIATEIMQTYLFSESARIYSGKIASATTPVPSGYRILQRGDSGEDVQRLQDRLYELGYMPRNTGSYFDLPTENAVKAFEAAYNRAPTGIATIDLQRTLFSVGAISALQAAAVTQTPTLRPTSTPAPEDEYTYLSAGSKGSEVTRLQNRLRQLGYMTSKADGIYGDKTVEAVMKFEAAYGKRQTGIATPQLQLYLYADDAIKYGTLTPTPEFTPVPVYTTLSYGSYGDDVLSLQLRLKELGYLQGEADGFFGKQTQNAVSTFEAFHGYTATGVATSALQKFLYSASAQYYIEPTAQAVQTYITLSFGSSGTEVSTLQSRLKELGYYDGSVNGTFDMFTQEAVKLFESAYSKKQTGVATPELQTALFSSSAKYYTYTPETITYEKLEKGSRGDAVAQLQRRLIELGYLSGTVDGFYGDGTADAVREFEAAYGRKQTGVATSELQGYIYSSDAKPNSGGNVAVSYISLSKGDYGQEVTNLQLRLIELGFLTGSATGNYDERTASAVKAYQKAEGLTQNGRATSDLQRQMFSSSAAYSSSSEIVTVNKRAFVSADQCYGYTSVNSGTPAGMLAMGTELTVLRTRGIWAEVELGNGTTGYVLLENLTYISEDTSAKTVTVNKPAVIAENGVVVRKNPSASASSMGTVSAGMSVTWLRTRGEWAEIKNSKGEVGYVYVKQLKLASEVDTGDTDTESGYGAYTTLKTGSTGAAVKALQSRLKELGYYYGDIGGNYKTITTECVKLFQEQIGLKADGVATPGLQDLMYSVSAPKYKAYSQMKHLTYTDMYFGRKDEAVSELQLNLINFGFLSANSVTFGTYDETTARAVASLQQALGLKNVDGIATRELQAFLNTPGANVLKR